LFFVTKDPARPFTVATRTGSVRVTGTTFNVRTEPEAAAFEVTVLEGSVQVTPVELPGAPAPTHTALSAGEQFSAVGNEQKKLSLSANDLDDALAWRDGKIVFRDTPLADALARYARHHGRVIVVQPAVAKVPVGGIYSIDDLRGFLDGIELTLSVKVNQGMTGAYSVGPRTGI
jgi:transmembrane sensor